MGSETETDSDARDVRQGSAGWRFKRLCASLDVDMGEELRRIGLNLNQFAVMMTLLEQEGMTQAEVGKIITMPGYSMTRTIDALEDKRFLERRADERSRRSHRLYLTDRGKAKAPELFNAVRQVNERLLGALGEEQRQQLIAILDRLLAARFG